MGWLIFFAIVFIGICKQVYNVAKSGGSIIKPDFKKVDDGYTEWDTKKGCCLYYFLLLFIIGVSIPIIILNWELLKLWARTVMKNLSEQFF